MVIRGMSAKTVGMKRRLILHLGLWKTGTTTIQSFLRYNPDVLARAGIHYPRVLPENRDHPLAKWGTTYLSDEVSHRALAEEIRVRARAVANGSPDTPLWSTAFRHIEASGASVGVISYEDFSARVASYDFERIRGPLSAYDVAGLVYLRHQESWATSLYAHMVRNGRTALPFADFLPTIRDRLVYSTLLDTIRNHIPLDQLVVASFEQAVATGLLVDFFHKAGLPRDPLVSEANVRVANRSRPDWVLLFLLRCAQAALPNTDLQQVRKALTRSVAKSDAPGLRPGLELATPEVRRLLRGIADDDAGRLWQRYGVRLDGPTPSATREWRPFDDVDFRTIVGAIAPLVPESTRDALGRL